MGRLPESFIWSRSPAPRRGLHGGCYIVCSWGTHSRSSHCSLRLQHFIQSKHELFTPFKIYHEPFIPRKIKQFDWTNIIFNMFYRTWFFFSFLYFLVLFLSQVLYSQPRCKDCCCIYVRMIFYITMNNLRVPCIIERLSAILYKKDQECLLKMRGHPLWHPTAQF